MSKEIRDIHFYTFEPLMTFVQYCYFDFIYSWKDLLEAINIGYSHIFTFQMGMLSTKLFEYGYRIFVHESDKDFYEIVLGDKNERTNRNITMKHDLFKLWKAGEFDNHSEGKDQNIHTGGDSD